MPMYEFRCRACDHKFEKLCRLSESSESINCPNCGKQGVEKQFSLIQRPRGSDGYTPGCASCNSSNCGSCH